METDQDPHVNFGSPYAHTGMCIHAPQIRDSSSHREVNPSTIDILAPLLFCTCSLWMTNSTTGPHPLPVHIVTLSFCGGTTTALVKNHCLWILTPKRKVGPRLLFWQAFQQTQFLSALPMGLSRPFQQHLHSSPVSTATERANDYPERSPAQAPCAG